MSDLKLVSRSLRQEKGAGTENKGLNLQSRNLYGQLSPCRGLPIGFFEIQDFKSSGFGISRQIGIEKHPHEVGC